MDCPTPLEPALLKCPACAGKGCGECEDRGHLVIDGCPKKIVDAATWELLRHSRFAEKGLLPVEGGTLDQTQWFIAGLARVMNDRQNWRARLRIPDNG